MRGAGLCWVGLDLGAVDGFPPLDELPEDERLPERLLEPLAAPAFDLGGILAIVAEGTVLYS